MAVIWIAGVDIGSVTAKAVVVKDGVMAGSEVIRSGGDYRKAAETVLGAILARAGLSTSELARIVVTGSGAANVPYEAGRATEISAHSKGVHHFFPQVRTVIDMGGQATRVMKVNLQGEAVDFVVSEKCASGSGRFLEVMARVLQTPLEEFAVLSARSREVVQFTTSCAVFAESEAISRIAEGASKEDIMAGVHDSMAVKVVSLVQRVRLEKEVAFTGGGARDQGLVKAIESRLGEKLLVPPDPLLTGALGAALLAGGLA
ncbi:MAG: 2-hydroxyglutaryl-CoA dehydratase [Chloroflexi bacterium]|nr:2-hydroxyglutaryl-CoA dehydratase [Chloroflexota bacterium]